MKRAWFALGILSLAISAMAQQTVQLTFPSSVAREIWVAASPPESEPKGTIQTEGGGYELRTQNPGTNDAVFVWDKSSGNLAFKPLKELQNGWVLRAEDFRYVLRVDVRIEHGGKSVETASVQLKDGRQDVSRLLDSTSKGTLSFWSVKPGSIKVAVTYTSNGQTKGPIKQTFELAAKRDSPVPTFVVSISDEVATVEGKPEDPSTNVEEAGSEGRESTSGSTTGKGDRPSGNDTTNPLGGLISFLIAVAVAALLVWFGLKWMKANQDTVQQKLQDMGVEMPDAQEPGSSATTIVSTVAAPPEKIILDGASPDVAPTIGSTQPGVPRLVGAAGTFELAEGDSSVSRELGEIVIPNDSTVSRRHATLTRIGSLVKVRDDGSTNGTFVNGLKLDGEVELKPGDTVQFGGVAFRFES